MVEVNGQKLIDRGIGQLIPMNLSRLVIVVGYKGKELKEYVGNRFNDKIKIEYVENPIYDKTNNIYSLALAKQQLCEEFDFLSMNPLSILLMALKTIPCFITISSKHIPIFR